MSGGMSEGGVFVLEEALGILPIWFNGGAELPGQGGAVIAAMLAVASGLCRHVLCFRTVWESTFSTIPSQRHESSRVREDAQWRIPFGAASPANWIALCASRYLVEFDAPCETLGWIALNGRRHASLNPAAIYRDPMTMDDYLSTADHHSIRPLRL